MDTDADEGRESRSIPFPITKRTPYKADTRSFDLKFPCSLDCPRHYGDRDNLDPERACGDFDRCRALAFGSPDRRRP